EPIGWRESLFQRAWIEQEAKQQLQQLAPGGPGDTEEQRESKVERDPRPDVRPDDWPSPRNGENRRRQECVDQPVAAAPDQLLQRRGRTARQPPLPDVGDDGERGRRNPERRNDE